MISQSAFAGITIALWILLTIGAIARGLVNIASGHRTGMKKFFLGFVFLMALVLANTIGFAFTFILGYCENCAGKSLGFQDLLTSFVYIAPSAIALFLCILKS